MAELAQQILHRPVSLLPPLQRLQQALASSWNLAQFDLKVGASRRWQHRLTRSARAWLRDRASRPLRWGLLALLLVNGVGLQAWIWKQSDEDQRKELQAILRSTFPEVTVVIDPVAQMQRQVQALSRASAMVQPDDLGVMLSVLAEVAAVPPKRLEYSAGQLQLPNWPLQVAQAQALQSALAPRGYELQASGAVWHMRVKTP
jgi:general secretion pathway protein L